jgi:hypothetical protein
MAARAALPRCFDEAVRVRLILVARGTPTVRVTTGLETVGGNIGVIAGGDIAGTLAALPMPEGSESEPFGPRAFAGPGGIPLTPASCAGISEGAATSPATTTSSPSVPVVHRREKIEAGFAAVMI